MQSRRAKVNSRALWVGRVRHAHKIAAILYQIRRHNHKVKPGLMFIENVLYINTDMANLTPTIC